MSPLEKLQFLIDARMVESPGSTFVEAVNYRAVQLDIGWATIIELLDETTPLRKWHIKEINELYQMREMAIAKAARILAREEYSELIH